MVIAGTVDSNLKARFARELPGFGRYASSSHISTYRLLSDLAEGPSFSQRTRCAPWCDERVRLISHPVIDSIAA